VKTVDCNGLPTKRGLDSVAASRLRHMRMPGRSQRSGYCHESFYAHYDITSENCTLAGNTKATCRCNPLHAPGCGTCACRGGLICTVIRYRVLSDKAREDFFPTTLMGRQKSGGAPPQSKTLRGNVTLHSTASPGCGTCACRGDLKQSVISKTLREKPRWFAQGSGLRSADGAHVTRPAFTVRNGRSSRRRWSRSIRRWLAWANR